MQWLLTLLLLASPAHATSYEPLDRLPASDLCGAVAIELADAIQNGLISREQAISMLLRCELYNTESSL